VIFSYIFPWTNHVLLTPGAEPVDPPGEASSGESIAGDRPRQRA